MRKNLKMLRTYNDMTQDQMADKLDITRQTYAAIENGQRHGSQEFWTALQFLFNIDDAEMWGLIKNDED